MIKRFLCTAVLALGVIAAPAQAAAQGEPVQLISSNGVKPAVQALARPAEAAIAHPLAMQFNTTVSLRQRIAAGESFDVAILTAEAIDALIKEGKIVARSRADVGSVGIGVGVRAGATKPDIRTVDAMKRTLLNAKSITYAQDGASRQYIEKMVNELGIAESVKPKTLLRQGSDASNASVASGEAELVITLTSEIMPAPGVELVGPLPAKFQNVVRFAAGVSVNAKNADAANALVKFLSSPKVAATFKAKGIQTAN